MTGWWRQLAFLAKALWWKLLHRDQWARWAKCNKCGCWFVAQAEKRCHQEPHFDRAGRFYNAGECWDCLPWYLKTEREGCTMLTVNFVWTCDYCGETKVAQQPNLWLSAPVMDYHLPFGWHAIQGRFACPKHRILVKPNQEEPADA